jgi:hypothetical protein
MVGPSAVSATTLAAETGIPQPTLSRWLRGAVSIPAVSRPTSPPSSASPSPAASPARRPQDWSALERAQVVVEAGELPEAELGEFLRRRGLHREQLEEWRASIEEALAKPRASRPTSESKRIKELERELARKEKALAEAAALLVLKKKMDQYWADADDDTDPKSGK